MEKENDLFTASPRSIQEPKRENACEGSKCVFNRGPTATTPPLSPQRFTPQFPAHPGWQQDDGARRVSWLPGRSLRSPSQGRTPQWVNVRSLAGYSCGGKIG